MSRDRVAQFAEELRRVEERTAFPASWEDIACAVIESDWLEQAITHALKEAADDLRANAGAAWGGDKPWLTSGTHVADLAAEWIGEQP